jgi:hypothetical protein
MVLKTSETNPGERHNFRFVDSQLLLGSKECQAYIGVCYTHTKIYFFNGGNHKE